MMRFECQNCEKKFELSENSELRCPFCFWTTSVRSLDQSREDKPKESKPLKASAPLSFKFDLRFVFIPAVVAGIIAIFIYLLKSGAIQKTGEVIQRNISKGNSSELIKKPESAPEPASQSDDLSSLFSESDLGVLNNSVPFEIPRKLTEEELGILNRKVELNINIEELGHLQFWTLDDFKKFLKTEQARRQIYFSWGYEKSLIDLFENHYLKAQTLFVSGQAEAARTELLNALVIPSYSQDLRIHRSVGLVMLKGFIDDAVKKIKVLNTYSVRSGILQDLSQLKEDYGEFLNLVNGLQWDSALSFASRLQERAKNLDVQARQFDVVYPPVFAQIDADIKASLNVPSEDIVSASTDLNSFLTDLKIKTKIIEQNTPSALQAAKNQYESAVQAMKEKKWTEARLGFESIFYPPEIAEDAKRKSAILSKIAPSAE